MEYAEDGKNLYLSIFDGSWAYKHYVLRKSDGNIFRGGISDCLIVLIQSSARDGRVKDG